METKVFKLSIENNEKWNKMRNIGTKWKIKMKRDSKTLM